MIYLLIAGLANIFSHIIPAYSITLPKLKTPTIKNNFIGKWNMQTIVTKSNCEHVLVGSTTESVLEILPTFKNNSKDLSLKALWKGGSWSKSSGTIKPLSNKEAILERVTELKINDKDSWKAILIDHFNLDENNIMRSESIVIQFKNGSAIGEYKTISILTRNEIED